jgi:hypothetical protein
MTRTHRLAGLILTLLALVPESALGAPEAHILRIDPRASQDTGDPILTSVVEVVQSKRVSEAIAECATMTGTAQFDCMSRALEKPQALYTPFPFPEQNAIFTVTVDGADQPAKYVSHARWGESQQQPGVGTAWLILVDADRRMGPTFEDAKVVADRFVASMGPNDIVNVMFFNDRQIVQDSKWLNAGQRKTAQTFIASVSSTYPSSGRNRSLMSIIKTGVTDGFKALGNVGETVKIPLHQALVVLSNGYGGTDAMTSGPGALQLQKYLTGGRFPEDNTALPKSPVPVVSVFFPHKSLDEFRQNSLEFMQNLANTEIGGLFTVMQAGQSDRAPTIVSAVRTRFSKMYLVKWRVSCIAPTITQTFRLVFNNVKPPILGDNTFKDVPVGIDPASWPLDINVQYTQDQAKRDKGVHPGGNFKVFGNFCWGGEKSRAEAYFLPAGQQVPAQLGGADVEKAKRTQQQLIAMGMRGAAIEATEGFVEFQAPDKDKILHGSGEQAVVRLVVYDNKAHRMSGVTADSILQLKGSSAPFPLLWVLGGAFALVVVALLLVIALRGGGRKRGGGAPPPGPVMAGPGPMPGGYGPPPYGAPPGAPPGYGYPPPGGGYPPPGGRPPGMSPAAAPAGAAQVPPGPSPEFLYGDRPLHVGVTTDRPAAHVPPPNPYGQASRATLQGAAGIFTVTPGIELRAGRDGAQCGILLSEPRVSSVHASLKLDAGQLLVRDENSGNGTELNGSRLAPGVWTPAASGSVVRFGPVEFAVRVE